jgi:hypothetical protein
MGMNFTMVRAIFRKDMRAQLGNPTGYVFLTLFIGITGAAAFLQDAFFARNLADLALLNRVMPAILMFFVPALTMSAWAEERRGGTEELLLTLPVRDGEVVLGKYLGVLGMFTVSLGFSMSHLLVLAKLGDPDGGLMFSTFLGYWLTGALFVAIGLLASMVTANSTVAFVLGTLGCSALVFSGGQAWAAGLLGVGVFAGIAALGWNVFRGESRGAGGAAMVGAAAAAALWLTDAMSQGGDGGGDLAFEALFQHLAVGRYFDTFGEGVIRLGDLGFFAGAIVTILYLCSFLLGRRHW